MRETEFIQQNKEKWTRFEKIIDSDAVDPKELGELYTEINADLSYAETFYKHRTVRAYLNYLAQRIHAKLYKQKRTAAGKAWKEWSLMIPLELFRARKNLLFAFILFVLWALIGVVSTALDSSFAELILGPNYVSYTEELIAEGNPMGIYGDSDQTEMFFQITINNIQVALLCFFGGVFFSLGTHIILFQNAVMVGAFQFFFRLKGLLLTSFLTIWIHGAFEISAIIVASAAGFTVGHGLLFPGSYSRVQSFHLNAVRGVRIMLSLIPVFILAGFLESFVTRHYQTLPDWSKWLIIIFSFALMLFYYVVYPIIIARKHPELLHKHADIYPVKTREVDVHAIKGTKEILQDIFTLFKDKSKLFFPPIFRFAFPIILSLMVIQLILHLEDMNQIYQYDWSVQLSILFGNPYALTFNGWTDLLIGVLWLLPLTIISAAVLYSFNDSSNTTYRNNAFKAYLFSKKWRVLFATSILYLFIYLLPYPLLFVGLLIVPFFFLVLPTVALETQETSFKAGFKLSKSSWSKSFGVLIVLGLLIFAASQPIALVGNSGDLLDMVVDFIYRLLVNETVYCTVITNVIRQLVYIFALFVFLPLIIISGTVLFYSANEQEYATSLWKRFKNFGNYNNVKETNADYEAE